MQYIPYRVMKGYFNNNCVNSLEFHKISIELRVMIFLAEILTDAVGKVYSVKYKDCESHDIQYQHHIRCHKLLGEVMVIIMFCVCSNIYIDMLSRKKCMCNRMKRICTFELYIILPFRLLLPFTYNINCVSVFGNIGND